MARRHSIHSLRVEWGDHWWEPSTDVVSMVLNQRSEPPHELDVVLYGHAHRPPPFNTELRIRCSWDGQNYWLGTARLARRELINDPEPIQILEFLGLFTEDPP